MFVTGPARMIERGMAETWGRITKDPTGVVPGETVAFAKGYYNESVRQVMAGFAGLADGITIAGKELAADPVGAVKRGTREFISTTTGINGSLMKSLTMM